MLCLKNLKKFYNKGQVKAVDIQELSVAEAHIACLIGPSGCGKTTTLKLINRLIEPDEGLVQMAGAQSSDCPPVLWRRKIGYVIQEIGLFPHLTVAKNISLLSHVLKRDKKWMAERVAELLELVGLEPKKYKNRYPAELSGGQQQRVGIARALMEDPPLLLMDEPFGALDVMTRLSLRKEMKKLNQKLQKTILMVTHDLNEAFEMGDKVVLMNKGLVEQEGTKEDFIQNPASQFAAHFLKSFAVY